MNLAFTEGHRFTAKCAATTAVYLRVTTNTTEGEVAVAGIAVRGIGHAMSGGAAADRIDVRSICSPGIHIGIASEAIAVGDAVYSAASGKISKTSGGGALVMGYCVKAASADGDQFLYAPTFSL